MISWHALVRKGGSRRLKRIGPVAQTPIDPNARRAQRRREKRRRRSRLRRAGRRTGIARFFWREKEAE